MLAIFLIMTFFFYLVVYAENSVQDNIIYVNGTAAEGGDGSSWDNAFTDLQDALAAVEAGDQIWVAAGIYYPAAYETVYGAAPPEVDRSATFQLEDGVALYGGFAGGEESLNERDWENNVTVLSGDLDRNDTTDAYGVVIDPDNIGEDNAYHVVTANGTGAGTVLDGFTITAGSADDSPSHVNGGGIYIYNSDLLLANNIFSGNQAYSRGGGAYISFNSNIELRNVNFNNNRTTTEIGHRGGGIYSEGSNILLTDVSFTGNSASSGGGLNIGWSGYSDKDLILENTVFNGNEASNGGGLYVETWASGNIQLSNVIFSGNYASSRGGGLYNGRRTDPAILSNVTFENNEADEGGGMANYSGSAELTGVIFTGNKATSGNYGGGGLSHEQEGYLVIENTVFAGNEAKNGGGLLILFVSDDPFILTNVLFSGNWASQNGGGIQSDAANLSLINTTLSGNRADWGGGIYNSNQSPVLTNCILWGNDASYGPQMYSWTIDNAHLPVISHSLIQGSGGSGDDWDESFGTDSGSNLDDDPLFIEPVTAVQAPTLSGNYRLQAGSPSVDTGTNIPFADGGDAYGVDTDLDGNQRIIGDAVDMGAYEFVYESGVDTGTLVVTIEPEEVLNAGAQWSIDSGATWYNSGTELDLDPGNYVLIFKKLSGLAEPPATDVSVYRGLTTSITGIYRDKIIYVKHAAAGDGDGSSWENAYTGLQAALEAAREGQEIWVASGVYVPTQTTAAEDPRTATFQLIDGVALYGGFAGVETSRQQRDWEANITVLSGDLSGDDITDGNGVVTAPVNITGDNAYTVLTADDIGPNTILDGFIITAGKSDGSTGDPDEHRFGGGMFNNYSSPSLNNLLFTGSHGGGMFNRNSNPTLTNVTFKSNQGTGMRNYYSSPTLTRVNFEYNTGGGMLNYYSHPTLYQVHFTRNGDFFANTPDTGGGMYNASSNPMLINVTFRGNYAKFEGGGMCNTGSNPTLINVLFSGNATGQRGGGMYNSSSSPNLINVTFSSNYSGAYGGAMFSRNSSNPVLTNCIIWHNMAVVDWWTAENTNELYNYQAVPSFSHSIVKGSGGSSSWNSYFGTDEGNNIDVNPLFVSLPAGFSNSGSTSGDYRLQEGSPAIDAGSNAVVTVTTDLDGNPRIDGGIVDMGAYEYQTESSPVPPSGGGGYVSPAPTVQYTEEKIDSGTDTQVEFDSGKVTITVPAGALSSDGILYLSSIPEEQWPPMPPEVKALIAVYEIIIKVAGETVTQFEKPLKIEFTYDGADLTETELEQVHAFYWDSALEAWLAIPTDLNKEESSATATLDHLTTITLMYYPGFPVLTDLTGHWARADILRIVSLQVAQGYPDNTFKPDQYLTRAEFSKMIVLALRINLTAASEVSFLDELPIWAESYILTAVESGLFTGYPDGTFRPQEKITREEMAAVLARAINTIGSTEGLLFTDSDQIALWSRAYVNAVFNLDIIRGYPDESFRPKNFVSRAEACAVFWRTIDLLFR